MAKAPPPDENVVSLHTHVFQPQAMAGLKPAEIKPLLATEETSSEPIAQGVDLSGRPKIIFAAGRGKTGKTLFLRWIAEMARDSGRNFMMADIDPTNPTFSTYFAGVSRPNTFKQTGVRDWLQEFMETAIEDKVSAIVDLGGGDTVLRTITAEMPGFDAMVEKEGVSMVMFYLLGPQPEDLTPVATLGALGFKPKARALVLNEGVAPVGQPRGQAFARVLTANVYRDEAANGALTLWMPKLHAAEAVEARTAGFLAARDGKTHPPLGVFNRSRINHWLKAMDEQFSGVKSWMP
ncbi:MAG: hypothetical protein ACREU3_03925 [Steroidobacteraceae bacterium]